MDQFYLVTFVKDGKYEGTKASYNIHIAVPDTDDQWIAVTKAAEDYAKAKKSKIDKIEWMSPGIIVES